MNRFTKSATHKWKWMFVIPLLLLGVTWIIRAATFTPVGTETEYEQVSHIAHELHDAVQERYWVLGLGNINSPDNTQSNYLRYLKQRTSAMLHCFADPSRGSGGSYSAWFRTRRMTPAGTYEYPSYFPLLAESNVVQIVNAPTNYFSYTPWRPLLKGQFPGTTNQWTQAGYTTVDYGWETLGDILRELKWIPYHADVTGTCTVVESCRSMYNYDNRSWGSFQHGHNCDTDSWSYTNARNTDMELATSVNSLSACFTIQDESHYQESELYKTLHSETAVACTQCIDSISSGKDNWMELKSSCWKSSYAHAYHDRAASDTNIAGKADWYLQPSFISNSLQVCAELIEHVCTDLVTNGVCSSLDEWDSYGPAYVYPWRNGISFSAYDQCIYSGIMETFLPDKDIHTRSATVSVNASQTCDGSCTPTESVNATKSVTVEYGNHQADLYPLCLLRYNFKFQ